MVALKVARNGWAARISKYKHYSSCLQFPAHNCHTHDTLYPHTPPHVYAQTTTGPEFGVKSKGAAVESSLPLQNLGVAEDGVEDMTRLDYLHEPAILFNLRKRFFRALPYTYTGEIVIACNPYR